MADRPYRITFSPLPIILHASSEKQALEICVEYLRQPGRIVITPSDTRFEMPK